MTLAVGLYYFAIAFVLAHLEIQIEGAHGWAEKLPTWRWQSPAVLRWAGKPVTGYHVFLQMLILLFIHLPVLHGGFSWEREAEILAFFFLLSVFWDCLWFMCNPHFGIARFRPGEIWWFKSWWLGLPSPYYLGLAASLAVYLAPAAATGLWSRRAVQWGMIAGEFLALTLVVVAGVAMRGRRRAPAPAPAGERS